MSVAAQAAENRCGWVHNPSPANMYMEDRNKSWAISLQGIHLADGMENIPRFDKQSWKSYDGRREYGYGCACMKVVTDRGQKRVTHIISGKSLPLRQCRADKALPPEPSLSD
jgi:hypothetical protein